MIEQMIIGTYAAVNSLRVFSYLPQIAKVFHAPDRAEAISLFTWSFWTLSNLTTAAYGAVILEDVLLVVMFVGNTICCTVVITIVAFKRKRHPVGIARGNATTLQRSILCCLRWLATEVFANAVPQRLARHLQTPRAFGRHKAMLDHDQRHSLTTKIVGKPPIGSGLPLIGQRPKDVRRRRVIPVDYPHEPRQSLRAA
jgi:uncharacterized protein with PQ loop repeat